MWPLSIDPQDISKSKYKNIVNNLVYDKEKKGKKCVALNQSINWPNKGQCTVRMLMSYLISFKM